MRHISMISLAVLALALALALIAGLALAEPQEPVQGKLVAVYADKQAFVVADNKEKNQKTFELEKNGKVFINDRPASLGDLMAGENVQVNYQMKMEKMMAMEVRCQRF